MSEADVIEVSREAIITMLWIAGPMMILTLIIGLIISVLQTVTQIQEQTLTFVPKMLAVFFASLLLAPYMLSHLTAFTEHIADLIIGIGSSG